MVGGFGVSLSAIHKLHILNSRPIGVEYLSQLKLMNACEVFITKHTGKCHVSIMYILYQ